MSLASGPDRGIGTRDVELLCEARAAQDIDLGSRGRLRHPANVQILPRDQRDLGAVVTRSSHPVKD